MKIVFRLDDFSHSCNFDMWSRVLQIFDKHSIKVCIGVIPKSEDESLEYEVQISDKHFWEENRRLQASGHTIALHGYRHVYHSVKNPNDLILPINKFSEFAGLDKDRQADILKKSLDIFLKNQVTPDVFMAPAHSFNRITVEALLEVTHIRHITDGMSYRCFHQYGINFIPQQFGTLRPAKFSFNTYCLHPNTMNAMDLNDLEVFIKKNRKMINNFSVYEYQHFAKAGFTDYLVRLLMISFRNIRNRFL